MTDERDAMKRRLEASESLVEGTRRGREDIAAGRYRPLTDAPIEAGDAVAEAREAFWEAFTDHDLTDDTFGRYLRGIEDAIVSRERERAEAAVIEVRDASYTDGFKAAQEIERERARALVEAARRMTDRLYADDIRRNGGGFAPEIEHALPPLETALAAYEQAIGEGQET